jgi:transcriptional regulator with XRE-family HTH domain
MPHDGISGTPGERTTVLAGSQVQLDIDDQVATVHNQGWMTPELSPAGGETIGQRLKRLRLDRGLSQRELAAPGVSYAYISRIEAGTRQPSVKALRRLATKLGVTADYLETGSQLAPEEQRELRLADLELAMRLGDPADVEQPLQGLLEEALAAGDRQAALRGRVALAMLAMERAEWANAAKLLEAALEGESFAPVDRYEIYAYLGRSYSLSGRPHEAVELYERCIDGVGDAGGDPALEARYATLLSYALSDMGELGRAEDVVAHALARLDETHDPYMRVRLYWSMARLAHTEGHASVALNNVRKAIALLQATDDTLHLARAHILAANITLSRQDADSAAQHLDRAEQLLGTPVATDDLVEIAIQRSRIGTAQGEAARAITFARQALKLNSERNPVDEGRALAALADGLALEREFPAAEEAYRDAAEALETQGHWRDAANACRAWARILRESNDEKQALDVLERAAELGTRAQPAEAHAER